MICKICNNIYKNTASFSRHLYLHELTPKMYYDKYIRKSNEGYCIICGKETQFHRLSDGYIHKYCSSNCQYKDKSRLSKDGKTQSESKLARNKNFELQNDCTLANTLRKQYGSGWYSANIIDFIFLDANTKFVKNTDIPKITEYYNTQHSGKNLPEKQIESLLKSIYTKEIKINFKGILNNPHYELDFYLPDINLAIEFNGIRYHSIEMGKPKDRILNKSIQCRNKNIRLIHIYEFEDFNQQLNLLKNLILGTDNYPKDDFNKNNLISSTIPEPTIIYNNNQYTIYGAGPLL